MDHNSPSSWVPAEVLVKNKKSLDAQGHTGGKQSSWCERSQRRGWGRGCIREDRKPGPTGWGAEDRGLSAADPSTVVQALGRCSAESAGIEGWGGAGGERWSARDSILLAPRSNVHLPLPIAASLRQDGEGRSERVSYGSGVQWGGVG